MNDVKKQRYLRSVRRELMDLPPAQRTVILADVESHIDDVMGEGASIDSALERLGAPRVLAADAREELAPGSASARVARVSAVVALALGVITALIVAFAAPFWNAVSRDDTGAVSTVTVSQSTDPWVGIIGVIPALVVLLALRGSPLTRRVILIILAAVMTTLAALGLTVLNWYLPFIAQLWVCVLLPMAVARGFRWPTVLGWRVAAGLMLAAPGLLLVSRDTTTPTIVACAASVLLAALWVSGISVADYLTVGVGALLMALSIALPGTFALATWWIGGLFVVLGAAAYCTRPRNNISGAPS